MDAGGPQMARHRFGERFLRHLRRRERRRAGDAAARCGRADDDDRPLPAPAHRRDRLPRGEEEAERIDPPRPLEILRRHVLDRAPDARAGVEDEHVDVAEIGADPLERRLDRGRVGDVAGIGPGARQFVREPLAQLRAPRQQRDRVAVRGESPGESLAVAGADADDGAHRSFVVRHRSILPECVRPLGDPARREAVAATRPADDASPRRKRLDGPIECATCSRRNPAPVSARVAEWQETRGADERSTVGQVLSARRALGRAARHLVRAERAGYEPPSASVRFRRCSSWTGGSATRSSRRSPTAPPRASRSSASGPACMSASICRTRPHYVIAFFGVLKAGGTVVNYSPLEALRGLEFKIEDSETDILVTLDVASLYPQAEKLLGFDAAEEAHRRRVRRVGARAGSGQGAYDRRPECCPRSSTTSAASRSAISSTTTGASRPMRSATPRTRSR